MSKPKPTRTIVRDARNGRFVKTGEATRRPSTTAKETIPVVKPKKK